MKINERALHVDHAELKMTEFLLNMRKHYELTSVEYIQFLTKELQLITKYMLRMERHGDPEKPADLE